MREKEELCRIAGLLFERGLVSGADGNISMRLKDDQMLITPSGVCKGFLKPDMLLIQKFDTQVIEGTLRSTKEAAMHGNIYRVRPDIGAVIHTHPAAATAFALCRQTLPAGCLVETEAVLGRMALVEYAPAGSTALAHAVEEQAEAADILFLANHGIITVGHDLEAAFSRMDAVENAARTLWFAGIKGTPVFYRNDRDVTEG